MYNFSIRVIMKSHSRRIICLILAVQVLYFNPHSISYAASQCEGKTKPRKIRISDAIDAEGKFYKSNFDDAAIIFESLAQKNDKNYALFNNQLGSIYLAKGDYEKALGSFLKAYYLMNDVSAFQNLESGAISLFGGEAKKAYKGDPYEKVFNSLYVSLLLMDEGELDNALAALKNGILCDSDAEAELYRSDAFALYLFAARLTLRQNNKSMSKDYFDKAVEAYRLSSPSNMFNISQKQAQISLLSEKREEFDKLKNPKRRSGKKKKSGTAVSGSNAVSDEKKKKKIKYSKRTIEKMDVLSREIEKIEGNIKNLESQIEENNAKIDVAVLNPFKDLKNNVFLCLELGRGPLKYQIGQYGQLAIFAVKPHGIKKLKVFVDNKEFGKNLVLLDNDTFFQATTRGGRKMDSILKGHAQFKQSSAEMALAFNQASQNIMDNARQMTSANPYYDASGQYAAAGVLAIVSLAAAIASAAANPVADVRHWSLMPGNIIISPLSVKAGKHSIKVECYGEEDNLLNQSKFNIEVKKSKDNIVFKRIF